MKCKFCDQEMKSKWVIFKDVIYCDNHPPVQVFWKVLPISLREKWIVSYNYKYRLSYIDNKTFLERKHPEDPRLIETIVKFDYELDMKPEQFPQKLKTFLVWL